MRLGGTLRPLLLLLLALPRPGFLLGGAVHRGHRQPGIDGVVRYRRRGRAGIGATATAAGDDEPLLSLGGALSPRRPLVAPAVISRSGLSTVVVATGRRGVATTVFSRLVGPLSRGARRRRRDAASLCVALPALTQ